MVKKFLENKNAELLLATQVIDSNESARTKRTSQRLNEQPATSKKKVSHKPHKLDAAKLAVKQQEKTRRRARKKLRQSEINASHSGNPRPGDSKAGSCSLPKPVSSNVQPTPGRRVKQVSFA